MQDRGKHNGGYGPALSAWSAEALAAESERQGCAPLDLKWSYADSPFCCYGEAHLEPVRPLFEARGDLFDLPDDAADAEFELRPRAMETAVARLDAEGVFGTGADRHRRRPAPAPTGTASSPPSRCRPRTATTSGPCG
ncbi:DUF4303 domain-containing protein [Streptomyces anthocyanicus]|uniref:DUF4303 domain-containing protein n=1 Tax=Streptomyces anthocyanicus TaxID=68174 RepID=UPI0033BB3209